MANRIKIAANIVKNRTSRAEKDFTAGAYKELVFFTPCFLCNVKVNIGVPVPLPLNPAVL